MLRSIFARFGAVGTTDETIDTSNHTESTEEVVDLKGDQFENNTSAKQLNLNYKDLWALALTTAVGGHYLTWNEGLTAGFGSYLIATVIIASGYVCLLSCLAELSSALPFAGKADINIWLHFKPQRVACVQAGRMGSHELLWVFFLVIWWPVWTPSSPFFMLLPQQAVWDD